jgi:uncharacterized flavoprotein (TIGR03862 family)
MSTQRLAVIGGGPAGLMAAEVARARGVAVDVYDGMGSVGRKLLLAGKGGLNLTHSEARDAFVARYGARAAQVASWLEVLDNQAVRDWARGLGIETVIGSSARVFPADFKAAPLLRRWVRRLRESGVRFHLHHRCTDLAPDGTLTLQTPSGPLLVRADAVVLALGGASWPQLGSDGAWEEWLSRAGVELAPLAPANCGFDVEWSAVFAERFAGHPVKTVTVSVAGGAGEERLRGELVVTATGIEGTTIYALSSRLRDAIEREGPKEIHLDLLPDHSTERLASQLAKPRGSRSLSEHLRRTVRLEGVKLGLLYERVPRTSLQDVATLATSIKSLPLRVIRPRPIAEAISTAGGVSFAALDANLMLHKLPGVFCAGEMIDWEAPTGGYLLTACFASGHIAGAAAAAFITSL